MLVFLTKLIYRRSPIFWAMFILLASIALILFNVILHHGVMLYENMMPRMWASVGTDRYIYLDTSRLSPDIIEKIKDKTPGISAYQIEPNLALTGLAMELETKKSQRLMLKIFSTASQNIKEDSVFSIQYQAPSTNQFIDYVLHSKQGKLLIEDGKNNAQKIYKQSQDLYENLLEHLKQNVSLADLEKLKKDAFLKQLILEIFQQEINNKINFGDLSDKLLDSSDFTQLMNLAFSQISIGRIFKTTTHQIGDQLGVLAEETVPRNAEEWLESSQRIILYALQCKFLGTCVTPILKDLNLKARGIQVAKGVGKDIADQAISGLKDNSTQALDASKNMVDMAVKETQIISHTQAFASHIFNDPVIRAHITQQYGEPMVNQLENAFLSTWENSNTQTMINEAVNNSKDIIQRFLHLMLLDQYKTGPNPLLLAMIKEKLQKQYEFNINIQNQVNSPAKTVPNGYIFKLEGNLQ